MGCRTRERRPLQCLVSRILSAFASLARRYGETIIPLGPASLAGSSDLPGDFGRAILSRRTRSRSRGTAGRLPIWPCSVRGFACHRLYSRRGALLPHLFTLPRLRSTREAPRAKAGGMFSVPLSFELPRPGVTRRTALWSSDFPPLALRQAAIVRSTETASQF